MNRCLGERRLLLAYYGEGPAADRAHLGTCLRCAAHYRRVSRDLEVLGQVLAESPPSAARSRRPRGIRRRSVLVTAAALAAGVVVGGVEVWMWRESVSWVRPAPNPVQAEAFLAEVSAVLSAPGESPGPELAMTTAGPTVADPLGTPEADATGEGEEGPLPGT